VHKGKAVQLTPRLAVMIVALTVLVAMPSLADAHCDKGNARIAERRLSTAFRW
jgi:hypothetical protein